MSEANVWRSAASDPPSRGEDVLCRGPRGALYVARPCYDRDGRYAGYFYRTGCTRVRDTWPRPQWWCPVPPFDGGAG